MFVFQNSAGNQPAHLAARNNQVELLKQICVYDQHIGRVVRSLCHTL